MPTYYTYKTEVQLLPGQTVRFRRNRGYYAFGTPTVEPAPVPAPAPASPPAGAARVGAGWWWPPPRAANQAVTDLAHGAWYFAPGGDATFFPGASRMVYKIATEAKQDTATPTSYVGLDQSASLIPASVLTQHDAWVAKRGGLPLRSFYGDHSGLIPDLGAPGIAKWSAENLVRFRDHTGIDRVYLDNMHGFITGLTLGGLLPDGYGSDDEWRDRAVLPFLQELGGLCRQAGLYLVASLHDTASAKLGETVADEQAGRTTARYVKQAGPFVSGVLREYWQQRPDTYAAYSTGDNAWWAHWEGWQALGQAAHDVGCDFHALTYANNPRTARFARGSFLLEARPGDVSWVGVDPSGPSVDPKQALADPLLTRDPGDAAVSRGQASVVRWARFPAGWGIAVNPTSITVTVTIGGAQVTVPGLDAVAI